ncbi:MAG: transglutaminase domain-containing protein [Lentisphaerae bacterium]|jgi:transglutaminase-like putative cysteine protease|nr:transglutaminase domain-containing protein [Lentisphaerota bacterium]MBT5611062.1 transglutaminase domain-containing protein [Lentisphaerota bacterium]MBT7055317.1 transglutaminase domain-containing protein [Lentisphaerota bacterium]MBT7840518.1 transglutaminase domain-containing protein [Lentisphaerota bacterium]
MACLSHLPGTRCLAFLAGACLLAFCLSPARADEPIRNVVFTVQVHNRGPDDAVDVSLRVPVPSTNDYQRVYETYLTPRPEGFVRLPSGGNVALLAFPRIPAGHSRWVFMHVRCRLREFRPLRDSTRESPDPKAMKRALGKGYKLDPNAPDIVAFAHSIRRGDMSEMATVRRLNARLCGSFEYELDERQATASETLKSRRGSCSELSRLFVAVARRCNIPARFAAGTRLRTRQGPYVDTIHHRWVEVHLEDYGWLPIDISLNVSTQDPERRFGAIPPHRLVMLRNAGLGGHVLFSTGLTMMSRHPDLRRTVRTYWFDSEAGQLKQALRDFARVEEWTANDCERLRRDLRRHRGGQVIPLLATLLYPPLAGKDEASALRAIANSGPRIPAVPLIDYMVACPSVAAKAEPLAERLTGVDQASPDQWRAWLRGPGRDFLRGRTGANGRD